jgi:hypothetical protein
MPASTVLGPASAGYQVARLGTMYSWDGYAAIEVPGDVATTGGGLWQYPGRGHHRPGPLLVLKVLFS